MYSEHSACRQGIPHRKGKSSYMMHDSDKIFRVMNLRPGDVFLDLGCGPGDYSVRAAEEVAPHGKVFGLDRSRETVQALSMRAADQGLSNLEAVACDMTEPLPLASGCVDVCLICTVLHCLNLDSVGAALFGEINRVLAPSGRLVTVDCKKEPSGFGPPLGLRLSEQEVLDAVLPGGFLFMSSHDLGSNYLLEFLRG